MRCRLPVILAVCAVTFLRPVNAEQRRIHPVIENAALSSRGFRQVLRARTNAQEIATEDILATYSSVLDTYGNHDATRWKDARYLSTCVFLMRQRGGKKFVDPLRRLITNQNMPKAVRRQAMWALFDISGDRQYFLSLLEEEEDDLLRASALDVLATANPEEIDALVQRVRSRGENFSGTHTGMVLAHIKSMQEVKSAYEAHTESPQRLDILIGCMRGLVIDLDPGEPMVISDSVYSQYLLRKFIEVFQEDPAAVRAALNAHAERVPRLRPLVEALLQELDDSKGTPHQRAPTDATGNAE
jgi:hypothetical protein